MTVRVVFADDNYLVREGVSGLLAETVGVDLVETVADPDALHRAVATHRPGRHVGRRHWRFARHSAANPETRPS